MIMTVQGSIIKMAEPEKKQPPVAANSSAEDESLDNVLKNRESRELIISLCGPVGCGINEIKEILESSFSTAGYSVILIKVSDLIKRTVEDTSSLSKLRKLLAVPESESDKRIQKLQEAGNELRSKFGNDICAALAIQEIATQRTIRADKNELTPDKFAVTTQTVFIIDQLKHPDEAALLNKIYRDTHYQIGILAGEDDKVASLVKERVPKQAAVSLIERDRSQNKKYGQQLEKTLSYSDYFISTNSAKNLHFKKGQVQRFIDLIHGKIGITPTHDEVGMNAAYTASLRSACLSRQVGAAICDDQGNVLSVGRNDVPKFGGGLYTSEDGENDKRCVHHGAKCYNNERISYLKTGIEKILKNYIDCPDKIAAAIDRVTKETDIGSLIEFSRAIHAEMDAIISIARSGNRSPIGTSLYTTTYPCHGCARHIVAAGIKRVVYIEPYPKSLATALHDDTVRHDALSKNHVNIVPFEGVAPKRHRSFFGSKKEKKDADGKAYSYLNRNETHIDAVLLAAYTDTESKVTEYLSNALNNSM